jgi:hypothetical protein
MLMGRKTLYISAFRPINLGLRSSDGRSGREGRRREPLIA